MAYIHFSKLLGEQMSNYYAPCFYKIDFDVIPSYIELPWFNIRKAMSKEVDNGVFVVSSNNKQKKQNFRVVLHIKFNLKRSRMG